MTHIAMPHSARMVGLPAQARVAIDVDAAREAGVAVQPRDRGVRHHAGRETATLDRT